MPYVVEDLRLLGLGDEVRDVEEGGNRPNGVVLEGPQN